MIDSRLALLVPLILLAACRDEAQSPAAASPEPTAAAATSAPARPALASCEVLPPLEEMHRLREEPLPVPDTLKPVLASDYDRYAVLTLDGETSCVDTRWMEQVENMKLSEDGRFLSFDWMGYEAFGHQIVDRATGEAIDTGVPPLTSPSGKRLAALDYSESGYGALNALAVWDIGPARVRELAKLETLPQMYDWRLDRWGSEDCLELSAIDWDEFAADAEEPPSAPRQRFVARLGGRTLTVTPASESGCKAA